MPHKTNRRARLRFLSDRVTGLIGDLGREPSFKEKIEIIGIARLEWELHSRDDVTLEMRLDAQKVLRRSYRDLGLDGPRRAPERSLAEHLARRAAEREARSTV